MIGMMPPPYIRSFIDQRKYSNNPLVIGMPQVSHSYQFQRENLDSYELKSNNFNLNTEQLHLKDFLTSSSFLLSRKKNRLRPNKEWIIKSKPFRNKNLTFYAKNHPILEKGGVLRKIYTKPQSAKQQTLFSKPLKAYQEIICHHEKLRASRNLPK
jgi:hypothetical protein